MIYQFRKHLSCAHFYQQPLWTKEKNRQEFGKCFTTYGHGHDYQWIVEVETSDPQAVDAALQKLIERLDHQHLNFVIPEFKTQIPTTENLALYLREKMTSLLPASSRLSRMKLYETPEIWVEL